MNLLRFPNWQVSLSLWIPIIHSALTLSQFGNCSSQASLLHWRTNMWTFVSWLRRQTSVKDNGHQSQRTNDVSYLRGHRSFFHLIAKADGIPWYSKVVHSARYRSHCPLWRVSILLRRKEILGSLCILNLYSKHISLYFQKSYAIKTDFVSKHL